MTANQPTKLARSGPAAALALIALLTVAAPAYADDHRGWDHHANDARRHWHHPPVYERDVYGPPVVYSPPPPVVEEPAGINLVVPLNFR